MKEQLERAKKQRFVALKNAYKTIDAFAVPSLSPGQFDKYVEVRDYLIKMYKKTGG